MHNIYRSRCGWEVITIDLDEGTTPMTIPCGNPQCVDINCMAFSGGYPAAVQQMVPTLEWYRKTEQEIRRMSPASQQHHEMGGLFLRPIKEKQ